MAIIEVDKQRFRRVNNVSQGPAAAARPPSPAPGCLHQVHTVLLGRRLPLGPTVPVTLVQLVASQADAAMLAGSAGLSTLIPLADWLAKESEQKEVREDKLEAEEG